jgi:hypothetical protein
MNTNPATKSGVGHRPLESVAWFPMRSAPPSHRNEARATIAKLAVGATVGLLFFLAHRIALAGTVWAVALAIATVAFVSPAANAVIERALSGFGGAVARAATALVLGAVFLLVLTPVRFLRRMLGADDLHLRDGHKKTFWLPCDDEARKLRHAGEMFATEAPAPSTHPLRAALVLAACLVLLAEGVLRLYGFGNTVLYQADPDIGYYPEPEANLVRYGGRVSTNHFGMRSPEIARDKPSGTFRIFMIGDSTLYGGSYVDQEDLYATRLQKELEKAALPGKVEVLAMGCNGWGPFHERGYLKHYPDAFQADLAIVHLPIDDVNRPLYGLMEVPFFAVQSPPRIALEEVASHLLWRYRAERSGKDAAWEAKQAPRGIHEYGLLADDLARAGAEVMFFVLPSKDPGFGRAETVRYVAWRKQLEGLLAERAVRSYYAEGLFAGRGDESEIYKDDVHLATPGHAIYAKYLRDTIASDSLRFRQWAAGALPPRAEGSTTKKNQPNQPAVEKP